MLTKRSSRGFTLVELLVSITIAAVMFMIALPSMSAFFQAAKLSSAAKGYQVGLQLARSEAIRRNTPVEFVLTDTPIAAGIENNAVPSANGKNWLVRVTDTDAATGTSTVTLIEAKSGLEGSGQAPGSTPSVTVAGSPAAFVGSVSFDGLGATTPAGTTVSLTISNPTGGQCAPSGTMRCQNVLVRPGGQVLVCDPAVAVAASGAVSADTRACPA